jgi:O-antigen ligase
MNGMFIGCFLPIAVHRVYAYTGQKLAWTTLALMACACVLSKSSMAFGALAVSVTLLALLTWKDWTRALDEETFIVILVSIAVVVVAYFWFDPAAFSSNGRTQIWTAALTWMAERELWLTGVGAGTAPAWLPAMQEEIGGFGRTRFLFLHNDWLQFLFETGIPGLALALAVAGRAFKQALKHADLCASLVAVYVCGLANWPLHSGPFAFSVAALLAAITESHPRGSAE